MELRASPRRQLSIEVEVGMDGEPTQLCKTRDVSLGGVFVASTSRLLNEGADLQLYFHIPGEHATRHGIRARVVRVSSDGAGLAFRDPDVTEFRTLQEILRYSSATVQ